MNISDLLTIKTFKINEKSIKFTHKTRLWCQLPYPNHPKGCPNYNKNLLCPPKAPFLKEYISRYNHFYLIVGRFNLSKYTILMLENHPDWSERQAACVLYWQGSAKKHLKEYIKNIYRNNSDKTLFLLSSGSGYKNLEIQQEKIYSMEAAGIDVFTTLRENNIKFHVKPKDFVLLVNSLCSDKILSL